MYQLNFRQFTENFRKPDLCACVALVNHPGARIETDQRAVMDRVEDTRRAYDDRNIGRIERIALAGFRVPSSVITALLPQYRVFSRQLRDDEDIAFVEIRSLAFTNETGDAVQIGALACSDALDNRVTYRMYPDHVRDARSAYRNAGDDDDTFAAWSQPAVTAVLTDSDTRVSESLISTTYRP